MGIHNLDNQYFGLDLQKINTSCKKLMLYFDKPNKITSYFTFDFKTKVRLTIEKYRSIDEID